VLKAAVVLVLTVAVTFVVGSVAFAHPSATTVAVVAGKPSELRFTLSKKLLPKGQTTFVVTNKGTLQHDFRIAGKKTPLISKGKKAVLKVTFTKAGKYPYLCTVAGHAAAGMRGTLTVK
jgi:uncharacterized cupredoxin-like copper-binding protein